MRIRVAGGGARPAGWGGRRRGAGGPPSWVVGPAEVGAGYLARPRRRAALFLKMPGLTSSRIAILSKSAIQRSGVRTGKSVPNRTLSLSRVFAYWTRIGGKYLGDQPDRSM